MLVKVCKHGNSLSVRLGAYFARTAGIRAGDMVDLFMLPCGEIRIRPQTSAMASDAGDSEGSPERQPVEEAKW